ncbi:fibronectin type III domain-containing protein [Marinoscillum pacificum]|uniref:fibronectin type III domain-containing protein n=1 Tax=Marinoscillum pacificum TaxID=392723 RepID=UPI0021574ACB|nr:hypothetical protein [Marinoscillum pacificum]
MTNITEEPPKYVASLLAFNNVIRKYYLIAMLLCVLLVPFSGFSQAPSFVFVRNAPSATSERPVIQVKWFSDDILNPEGFNLYRRELGALAWNKINNSPITRGVMPAGVRAADPEIDFLVDVVTKSPEDLKEEFLYLNLLLKTFESNQLASFLGIFYNDSGVRYGVSYEYRVGVIKGGSERFLNQSRPIQSSVYQKAEPVSGVELFQDGKIVAINWAQDEQSFYGVNLFAVDSNSDTTQLNSQPVILSMVPDSTGTYAYPDPMFKANGFKELETYSFFVEGVDYFGEETKLSEGITMTYDDTTPPPVPYNVQGNADSLRVILTWEQDLVPDFKGFNVYRSSLSTGPYKKVNAALIGESVRSFRERLEVPGPYYYTVEAVDHSNNPIRSSLAFVEAQDVFPPAKPEGLTIESDTGRFILRWQMNEEPDLFGYYIYRTVDANLKGNYVLMNGDPIDSNVYVQVLPKVVKNDFYYYIVAIDTSFNRSPDSEFATAVLPDVTPPEQPFIESIDYTEEGIVINWTRNVELDLSGYNVLRADSAKGEFRQINLEPLPTFSTRYTDRSANPNQEYFYVMQAVDQTGNKSVKEQSSSAFWYQLKEVEESLTLKIKTKKRAKTNRLEWNLIDDNSIKGYMVFRGPSKRVVKPLTNVLDEKFSYNDRVEKGKEYFYQVRAYTTSGQVIYSEILETRMN